MSIPFRVYEPHLLDHVLMAFWLAFIPFLVWRSVYTSVVRARAAERRDPGGFVREVEAAQRRRVQVGRLLDGR